MPQAALDDMALFVEVARAGNFSRACLRLGLANATLSRRIAAMEVRLGVRLFERSTRHVAMTAAAQRFFARCAPLVDEARLAQDSLRTRAMQAEGHVRASMPVDLGVAYLGPWLPEFRRRHPAITLDLDLSPRYADLRSEPFDVALRVGPVRGEGLVARRVGVVSNALYAAPAYLDAAGRPKAPDDLAHHACLHIGSALRGAMWQLGDGRREWRVRVRGPIGCNSMSLARLMAERGLGVALLPVELARAGVQAGVLEAVLPRCALPGLIVHAVTTSRLQPAAVRAFIDFVHARLTPS